MEIQSNFHEIRASSKRYTPVAPPLRHWNFLKQIEHLIKYEHAGDETHDMETVVLRAVKLKKLLFAPYHTQKSFCSSITNISDIGGISRGCLIFKVFESRCSVRSDGSFVYLCVQDINSCSHLLSS